MIMLILIKGETWMLVTSSGNDLLSGFPDRSWRCEQVNCSFFGLKLYLPHHEVRAFMTHNQKNKT